MKHLRMNALSRIHWKAQLRCQADTRHLLYGLPHGGPGTLQANPVKARAASVDTIIGAFPLPRGTSREVLLK